MISTKIPAVGVLLCNVTKPSREAVADPTWMQSKIAAVLSVCCVQQQYASNK